MKYLKKNRVIIIMLRSYCCVVFSFLIAAAYGQTPQPKFIALSGSRNYSDIKTIFADSKNFLWFGCNQGLIRFDGSKYTRFAPDNSSKSIPSSRITALHEDTKGITWIGTADKGLFYYNYSTDKFTPECSKEYFAELINMVDEKSLQGAAQAPRRSPAMASHVAFQH